MDGQIIQITRNLSSALHYLSEIASQMANRLVIWIDALCINQSDFSERAAQVRMMGDIYSRAQHVLVWLGSPFKDSNLGLDMIEKVGNAYCELRDTEAAIARIDGFEQDRPWIAMSCLLKQSWWTRIWTFQEIVLAKEVSVICGTKSISWNAIYHTLLGLKDIEAVIRSNSRISPDVETQVQDSIYDPCVNMKARFWASKQAGSKFDLLELLSSCRDYESTDPRDKIIQYLRQNDSLSMLREAGLWSSKRNREDRLPSWVPDWRYGPNQSLLPANLYRATLDTRPKFSVLGEKLIVKGLCCGQITTVQPNQGNAITSWLRLAVSMQPETYEPLGIPRLQAYFRTLFCDWNPRTYGRLDPTDKSFFSPAIDFCGTIAVNQNASDSLPDYVLSFAAESGRPLAQAMNICILQQDDPRVAQAYWDWEEEVEVDVETQKHTFSVEKEIGPFSFGFKLGSVSRNRCFLTTSSGHMGTAPEGAEKGDLICVLLGHCAPVVLRHMDGNYVLIGDCFVMGLMDGEVLKTSDWEDRLVDFTIV